MAGGTDLLIVALELLRLVVAGSVPFPRTVEETVCLWRGVLIEWMIPRSRLSIPTGATSEGRRHDCVFQEFTSVKIFRGDSAVSRMVAKAVVLSVNNPDGTS
jgi:hypothetical protein